MSFSVQEEFADYSPSARVSWSDGGSWPHSNHYGFHEAVVSAHFVLLSYHVLRDFRVSSPQTGNPLLDHTTALAHAVVGPEITAYFVNELPELTNSGSGQPDLFVFRAPDNPADLKIHYRDPRLWFFVEVKGPGDVVQPYQETFWRAIAERSDIGLGPERIRLFRTAPEGTMPDLKTHPY